MGHNCETEGRGDHSGAKSANRINHDDIHIVSYRIKTNKKVKQYVREGK